MPKLRPAIIDANRKKIERVALRLFCAQGFHGTSMRQIAERSKISLGNFYNYYKTKDELFTSIVNHYGEVMQRERQQLLESLQDPFDPEEMKAFALRVRDVVYRHGNFWLLMYVDVTEFGNRHFKRFFSGLGQVFRNHFAEHFAKPSVKRAMRNIDPGIAFGAIWMQFFNYFLVERLFRGNRHLGASDREVIEALSKLYARLVRP